MSQHLNKRSRAAFEKEERSPYLIYGTPFPPKTEEKPDIYKPIWKQEVIDERGRKRLHGAFQGGFSAGYFNTVGSKEGDFATPGWTPSTFTSSRTNRAKIVAPKPEDFMDDDDLTEAAADEERRLQREAENSGLTAEGLADQGLNNTAELFKILHSVDEFPLGKEILHNLGWREGQGIGPKIRRKLRDQDAGEDDFKTFLFAPDDVVLPSWMKDPPKTDTKGLGYSEELRGDDDEPLESLKPSRKPVAAIPNVRLGMGVGVFNDDGEDDEDIYEIKPKSAYNKAIGGDKKKKKKAVAADAGAPGLGKPGTIAPGRHVFVSKKDSLNKPKVKRCMDGTLPLPGFMLDDEPLEAKWANDTSLPEVPDDWIPQRRLANPDQYMVETSRSEESMKQLKPREIGSLLGEEQLPNKSVFDFLTPAARERIAAATGKNNLPRALGEQVNTGKDAAQKMQDAIPYLEQSVAMNALKGFLPYADAPEKRQRYRAFLESKAGTRPATLVKDKGVSLEDWARELHEFAHAARIFKPVTGLMANRFTSSSSNVSQLPTTGGSKGLEGAEETLISRPTAKVEDPAVTAAKMGMFGPMTRTTIQFFPTRLLCKRFNVPPPIHVDPLNDESFGESGGVATKDVELVNKVELNRLMIEANTNPGWKRSGGKESDHADKAVGVGLEPMDVDEIAVKASEEPLPYIDLLEEERPGIEVFKAIFGDDTDEEED